MTDPQYRSAPGDTPSGSGPRFDVLPNGRGISIVDPIEDVRFHLLTEESVGLTPADVDEFYFPVDAAVDLDVATVTAPIKVNLWVRDRDGNQIADVNDGTVLEYPADRYTVEFSSAPIKLYLRVDGQLRVEVDDQRTLVETGPNSSVSLGARSYHERPARTITTTTNPTDLMVALSMFGAALKTTSCERSFPTLRGHPPMLEIGDELHVPDGFEVPETDIEIHVPPSLEYIYPVASIAYYLAATVRPAERPALVVGGEWHPLPGSPTGTGDATEFADHVSELLRHFFTLDCSVRTEGYYNLDLVERAVVERELAAHPSAESLDFAALYDRPLAEQLRTYLRVPFDVTRPAWPEWRLTADVVPVEEHLTVLPFLANELATVRCPADAVSDAPKSEPEALSEFYRGPGGGPHPADDADEAPNKLFRSAARSAGPDVQDVPINDGDIVDVDPADSVIHAWVGDGFPVGASKVSETSFRRQLARRAEADTRIEVAVICNDEQMRDETVVGEFYGARDLLEFDVSINEGLTMAEVQDVLASDADFVHFIGHVDARGMQCADGYLAPADIQEVNIGAFFLNACRSFKLGQTLVDEGAIGGVVTLERVMNRSATDVGRTVARLVNQGWPLETALSLIQERSLVGHQYLTVGDGTTELVQTKSGTPIVTDISSPAEDDETITVDITAFPSKNQGLGSFYSPFIAGSDSYHLNSGHVGTYEVTPDELEEFMQLGVFPIRIDNLSRIHWSNDFDLQNI